MGINLENAVAIITGASSGIGKEAALEFARKGVRLSLAARREAKLNEVADAVRKLGSEALVVPTDVSLKTQVDALVKKTLEHYGGRIDILLNNAGYGQLSTIEETSAKEMKDILAVNYMGTYYATAAVLPHMKQRGSGHIINISSVAGARGFPLMGAYCVTKAAQRSLTEALRIELDGTGVHASVVCPVFTETEFFDAIKNKTDASVDPPSFLTQTAARVAKAIVKCAENPKPEVLPFPLARVLIVLNAISPSLVDFILKRYYKSFLGRKIT